MFEFAWPWIFALLPLPWLMRLILPVADSGEPALKVSYLGDLEGPSPAPCPREPAGLAPTSAVRGAVAAAVERRRTPAMVG